MVYAYQRADSSWQRQVITQGEGGGFGISTMAGDIDLVAPGKSGLYLLVSGLNPSGTANNQRSLP